MQALGRTWKNFLCVMRSPLEGMSRGRWSELLMKRVSLGGAWAIEGKQGTQVMGLPV